jgi:soluble lytic murein transglycosylase
MRLSRRSLIHTAAVLAGTLSLTACGLLSPARTPEPVEPSAPSAQPTATPAATVPPAPTATATPLPIEAINQGERDLRNGAWEAAAATFQQALGDPGATPDERAEAQLGLAHAQLRSGDFTSAQATLDGFLTDFPDHPQAAQAFFLRGDAKLGLSDWAGAIADYESYLTLRPDLINSYVHERIADAHLGAGEIPEAMEAYEQAADEGRQLVSELQLREKIASIYRSLGNTGGAVAQYQTILSKAENPRYRATISFNLGQTWFEAGEYEAAYTQFEQVFMEYPETAEALSALRALLDADRPVDQYQRGLVNYYQGQYDIALQAFLSHLADLQNVRNDTPETHLFIARSYRYLGNIQAAQSETQALITRFNPEDGEGWGEAWLELADLYTLTGDVESAFATYDEFTADYPDLPQVADALAQAGSLAVSEGQVDRASAYFAQLSETFPDDPRAAEGLFDLGLLHFRKGQLEQAAEFFEQASALPASEQPSASAFWLGKARLTAGDSAGAESALQAARDADPAGYYGIRAAELMADSDPFTPPAAFTLPDDPDAGRAEAEQWIVDQFGLEETPPLATTLREDITGDPRMARGRELWSLGLVGEAARDFEEIRTTYEDDPLATYQLMILFREMGAYRPSILAAARLHTLAEVAPLEGPEFLARVRYPTYFADLVLQYAEDYGLDPLFVFALIEQESLFEGFATSSASAQGLMQIWPPTGEDIAAQLEWPDYEASDLQRPVVNIAFGTWLLGDEFSRFGGDPYPVLAAYNAGSGNALTWQQEAGGDPDMFIEMIDIAEPRTYVQHIAAHYANYRALYGVDQ